MRLTDTGNLAIEDASGLSEPTGYGCFDQDDRSDEYEEMYESCPNCGAIWGCEEFDFQECDCCGYPDNEISEMFDDSEIEYEPFD